MRRLFCAVIGLVALSGPALAADRTCTKVEKDAADKILWLGPADKAKSLAKHLPWGEPQPIQPVARERMLIQRDYVIRYDDDLLVPLWTAHRLDFKGLHASDRINCFRKDPRVGAAVASTPTDYKEPIFDQGHMTPNGDMSRSDTTVINSFIMSNMTPQYCQFNRGVWQILENLIREHWAKDFKTVFVMTGSVFDRNSDGQRDPDAAVKHMKSNNGKERVAVPSHFYKVVMRRGAGGAVESLTIILRHDQTDLDGAAAIQYLGQNVRKIADVERIAGIKVAPKLTGTPQEAAGGNLWPITGTLPRSLVSAQCRATAGAG